MPSLRDVSRGAKPPRPSHDTSPLVPSPPGQTSRAALGPILALMLIAATPADALPAPKPERCIPFDADPAEGEMAAPEGLGYDQVRSALNGVIQTALKCGQPAGYKEVHLTFELVVGCNGVVASITASEDDGVPDAYLACITAVIKKADFAGHDMVDGMPVTYPVNVNW